MAEEARTDELKAQNHAACLDGAKTITAVINDDDDFCNDMTTDEKKARVSRSMGYLVTMMAKDDWGSEDMTKIKAAIAAGTTFVG